MLLVCMGKLGTRLHSTHSNAASARPVSIHPKDIDVVSDYSNNFFLCQLLAYPGESLSIPLRAFDELNKPAAAALRLSDVS